MHSQEAQRPSASKPPRLYLIKFRCFSSLPAGLPQGSMLVFRLLSGVKIGFSPAGRHIPPINVKLLKGIRHLEENFQTKIRNFSILSYLSPHFYAYNVEICLNRTDLGNTRNPSMTKFGQNRSMNCTACHAVLHCLLGDAYWYLVTILVVFLKFHFIPFLC